MNTFISLSPQVLAKRIGEVDISGTTTGFVFSMDQILSGGTNGVSLLSELTIPILLTETIQDLGYYDTWDGNVLQSDVMNNFIYSASTIDSTNKTICVFNTSDSVNMIFLTFQNTTFEIYWGDNTIPETITVFSPLNICHTYSDFGEYEITMRATNVFGVVEKKKKITIPLNETIIPENGNEEVVYSNNNGSWSGTPSSEYFNNPMDSNNAVNEQISIPNYVENPFLITGFTFSRLNDLSQYGISPFISGPIYLGEERIGTIICNPCSDGTISYSIGNPDDGEINFLDYPDGQTIYSATSVGLFSEWLLEEPIVKNEYLLKISDKPEVQSNVFIERGKLSVSERIQRLGEVDNIGDMERYGYKFFKLVK